MVYDFNFTAAGYEVVTPYDFLFYITEPYNNVNLLPSAIDNLISIDIDSNTSMTNGLLYITMNNSFLVIDMATKSVQDLYTTTVSGRSLETLDYEDIEKSDVD